MNQASGHVRAKEPWRRYLPWQGGIEVAFWVFAFAIPALANTMVALMDAQRDDPALPAWPPARWEGRSALVSLLLLPALLVPCRPRPLHDDPLPPDRTRVRVGRGGSVRVGRGGTGGL